MLQRSTDKKIQSPFSTGDYSKKPWLFQHADRKNITLCPTNTMHPCSECSKFSCHRIGLTWATNLVKQSQVWSLRSTCQNHNYQPKLGSGAQECYGRRAVGVQRSVLRPCIAPLQICACPKALQSTSRLHEQRPALIHPVHSDTFERGYLWIRHSLKPVK